MLRVTLSVTLGVTLREILWEMLGEMLEEILTGMPRGCRGLIPGEMPMGIRGGKLKVEPQG
jgi:hypothetical protein